MKKIIGYIFLTLAIMMLLVNYYFIVDNNLNKVVNFSSFVIILISFIFITQFGIIRIFDNREWQKNENIDDLVRKIRLRSILFNNISVIVFLITISVIVTGFYFLVKPPIEKNDSNSVATELTVRIGASVLLIFLVQILFRVFKYLLRVAAFYNGRADVLDLSRMKPDLDIEKMMEWFTPKEYDIIDIQQSSVTDNIIKILETKLGK